ncbi:MAG: hypothetical protein IJY39_08220 [Clostridia bacterium]|nr:hypothetical protein [Clostridia bacterium]
MKKTIAAILALTLLASAFVSCDSGAEQSESTSIESTAVQTEADGTTLDTTEGETETETETETEPPVEAALPEGEPDLTYVTDDGYKMSQYDGKEKIDYRAACAYYIEDGYTLYTENKIGTALSSTFIKDDAYRVVMINQNKNELYIGECESGAGNFPVAKPDYVRMNDTTVTQHRSDMENGMGYFIRLADGSFIIFDGGHYEDTDDSYALLCRLNGSEENIRIRAWFITHSHGDHFRMFSQFSKDYADKVQLDTLYYCAVVDEPNRDPYLNGTVKTDLARFEGAKAVQIHTGMAFDFADVRVEILCSPDQVYKNVETDDFNESSVVSRVISEEGSIIINGDIGVNGCSFMMDCYGEALKSDMVQMAHHGLETSPVAYYDLISPSTVFIPYGESLGGGGRAKQHVMQSEYAQEIISHGYGNATRLLSHKAVRSDTVDLMPARSGSVTPNRYISSLKKDSNGYLTYTVVGEGDNLDVNFWYPVKKIDWDTTKYNAVRIVIDSYPMEGQEGLYNGGAQLYFTSGKDNAGSFTAAKSIGMFRQGHSTNDTFVLIGYLGNVEGFTGEEISSLRIDIGATPGQQVVIRSIEAFHVEIDED